MGVRLKVSPMKIKLPIRLLFVVCLIAIPTLNSQAQSEKPLNVYQILRLLAGGVPAMRMATLAQERGIDFEPSLSFLRTLREAGANDSLLDALKSAPRKKLTNVPTDYEAKQAAQAVEEYRAALQENPNNAILHFILAYALNIQGKFDEGIAELREAIRLKPDFAGAHNSLGNALATRKDIDSALLEYHTALRLNPDYPEAHINLGLALGEKRDYDGSIAEYNEVLRLKPDLPGAHYNIGWALERKADPAGALNQYRLAYESNPKEPSYKAAYERLLNKPKK
jgi:tetratricopeptide (TPR) repeat protein